jgi:orotidine-5'-phosphate decarboxylase
MEKINAQERLILALDVPTVEAAERLLDSVKGAVSFVKVGLELYTAAGPEIIRRAIKRGQRVFVDLKFLDIEETVRRATAQVAHMGVEFLTIHANRKALAAAVDARRGSHLKLLAVTVLTNFDSGDLHDMGVQWSVADLVVARAKLAADVGCDGVVASGAEAQVIRHKVGRTLLIVTPGIRPAGVGTDEHARIATPAQAIKAGANYLVVGRPIRDANDPCAAANAIVAEMQSAFDTLAQTP